MSLEQIIMDKAPGVLPDIPGESLPDQLWNGRQAAVAAVEQYTGKLSFDTAQAEAITSEIEEWMDLNREALEEALGGPIDPNEVMPSSLQLVLEKEKMQQWVIGQLTLASEGLGPWMSGRLASEVANVDSPLDYEWALDDGDTRLEVFGMILRMEESGELQQIFTDDPSAGGLASLGAIAVPLGWIVVALLGTILIITLMVVLSKNLQAKTAIQRELCLKAQEEGDKDTVQWCLKALSEADPAKQIADQLGKVAIVLGGGFLLVRFGLPFLLDLFDDRRAKAQLRGSS